MRSIGMKHSLHKSNRKKWMCIDNNNKYSLLRDVRELGMARDMGYLLQELRYNL
jgi:hypothetical protein